MFSPWQTTDANAMRPGLISGNYPERGDCDSRWTDRFDSQMKGFFFRITSKFSVSLETIAKDISRQGDTLTPLNDKNLDTLRIKLRRQLYRQGLTQNLCIQSFALIRETALRTIELRHYDSQIMAGWVMLQRQVAEMETGEGKTLAATLTAATLALAKIPVHILTANEYLVERDARAMAPLYKALGLTVGFITQDMTTKERQAGYACDILYCTNKQIVFDYLRDRLLIGKKHSPLHLKLESAYRPDNRLSQFLLRGLSFAILDEADSLLIDEARTPLILTRNVDTKEKQSIYSQILTLAKSLENNIDFFVDQKQRLIQLSRAGQQKLSRSLLSETGPGIGKRMGEELVCHALHAMHLLQKDRDYLVQDSKVHIIDANTGRSTPDRSWEKSLHQFVEAKENCPFTQTREQLGRLTYQRFFGRYLGLSGMTGTAREVGSELWSVYGLKVRQIPLHRPSRRCELPPRVFSGLKVKWTAVIALVKRHQSIGQPVLIGTGSLADSEMLSKKLSRANVVHQVLNARQDKAEAKIVANAGQKGQVTVATNMAGRGTDIPLGHGVERLGGLHVIATSLNQAKRIDRQLFGRCARQGDPGSHQFLLSLEDELISNNCPSLVHRFLIQSTKKNRYFINALNMYFIKQAQKGIEYRDFLARKALLKHDSHTSRMLSFSGHME